MNEQSPHDDELALLALQYIGDELADDTRAAFEARLLEDQAAREAVAAAVELALATRAAFAEDAALVQAREALQRPSGNRGWWSVALAASVLIGLIVVSQSMERVRRRHAARTATSDSQLAIAWSETRHQWPVALSAEDDRDVIEIETDEDELYLPTWMIAAVSDASPEISESSEGDAIPE